jgi:hypothetical protein
MFLESWYTKSEKNSINICRDMPGAYFSLTGNKQARADSQSTRKQPLILVSPGLNKQL